MPQITRTRLPAYISLKRTGLRKVTPVILHGVVSPDTCVPGACSSKGERDMLAPDSTVILVMFARKWPARKVDIRLPNFFFKLPWHEAGPPNHLDLACTRGHARQLSQDSKDSQDQTRQTRQSVIVTSDTLVTFALVCPARRPPRRQPRGNY